MRGRAASKASPTYGVNAHTRYVLRFAQGPLGQKCRITADLQVSPIHNYG